MLQKHSYSDSKYVLLDPGDRGIGRGRRRASKTFSQNYLERNTFCQYRITCTLVTGRTCTPLISISPLHTRTWLSASARVRAPFGHHSTLVLARPEDRGNVTRKCLTEKSYEPSRFTFRYRLPSERRSTLRNMGGASE